MVDHFLAQKYSLCAWEESSHSSPPTVFGQTEAFHPLKTIEIGPTEAFHPPHRAIKVVVDVLPRLLLNNKSIDCFLPLGDYSEKSNGRCSTTPILRVK